MSKKSRALKYARNISIAIVVLVVLSIGAGLAYTWYIGQFGPKDTPLLVETEEKVDYRPIQPTEQAANVQQGVSVQSLTSPTAPGSNASVIIKTNPRSTCTIVVEYNKIPSKDSGLTVKQSDEYGIITWAWSIEPGVPIGKWPVKVTCVRDDKSAVVIGDLVVAYPE